MTKKIHRISHSEQPILNSLEKMEVLGIEVWAYHGVFDQERTDGQIFKVDARWWQDFRVRGDDLDQTINYAEVTDAIIACVQDEPVNLIETLADRLQVELLSRFPMTFVQVTIHKPQAPLDVNFSDVAVTTAIAGYEPPVRQVVLSLGSNIEPRMGFLQFAVSALESTPGIQPCAVSSVYETEPQGELEQPQFLNAVIMIQTSLSARSLLARTQEIENLAGRVRAIEHGPRTLDIDIIAIEDEVWDQGDLVLPHPRAALRQFVLVPWLEIDPQARLEGLSIGNVIEQLTDQGIVKTNDKLMLVALRN
ncbi:MAG: 2-amino-4-hydroxy-6-hydroxymethyldihydropteridine diphosphokinase [Propionibacteriaceae bacterium]|nr:2-amino-4-hydroxy-6-hydroxymethyldihydropteridine diphosphokinase [Propionibacteriaceae bacterium]